MATVAPHKAITLLIQAIAAQGLDYMDNSAMDKDENDEEETKEAEPPRLSDMFAPPTHIIHTAGGFQGARTMAKDSKRWLLVNIQRDAEFASHALNRDVWRDEFAENLVREGFIFWQQMDTHPDGQTYCQRYKVYSYPHIAIIDPRTGRLMWSKEGWTLENPVTAETFSEMAMDFCSRFSLDRPPEIPRIPQAGSSGKRPAAAQSEADQLQAALRASMAESGKTKTAEDDDDEADEFDYEDDVEVVEEDQKPAPQVEKKESLAEQLKSFTVPDTGIPPPDDDISSSTAHSIQPIEKLIRCAYKVWACTYGIAVALFILVVAMVTFILLVLPVFLLLYIFARKQLRSWVTMSERHARKSFYERMDGDHARRTGSKESRRFRRSTTDTLVFDDALLSGAVALLNANWLIEFSKRGNPLKSRQELPKEAFLNFHKWVVNSYDHRHRSEEEPPEHYAGMQLIALSYMWLDKSHPDPQAITLGIVGLALRNFFEMHPDYDSRCWGVFWDFGSLYQHPSPERNVMRSAEQEELFQQGLKYVPLLFAHRYTTVFILRHLPVRPSSFDTHNVLPYRLRGWPSSEQCWTGLQKFRSGQVVDVKTCASSLEIEGDDPFKATVASIHGGLWESDDDFEEAVSTPMGTTRFKQELLRKSFTNGHVDRDMVVDLHDELLFRSFCWDIEIDFSSKGFKDTALDAATIREIVEMTLQLRRFNLSHNDIGKDACVALSEGLLKPRFPSKSSETLEQVDLSSNVRIGDDGVAALAIILQHVKIVRLENVGLTSYDALFFGIAGNVEWTELNISGNCINEHELADFGALLCTRAPNLRRLIL